MAGATPRMAADLERGPAAGGPGEEDVLPRPDAFARIARAVGPGGFVAVAWRRLLDLETPVSLFLKLRPLGATYLLESALAGERPGRYSIVGVGVREKVVCRGGESPFAELARLVGRYRVAAPEGLPPFYGGAVGYVAYDAVRHLERVALPVGEPAWPEAEFVVAETVVVFDHVTHAITLATLAPLGALDVEALDRARRAAVGRLARAFRAIASPMADGRDEGAQAGNAGPTARGAGGTSGAAEGSGTAGPAPGSGRRTSLPRAAFTAAVRRALERIRAGDVYQVVLAQQIERRLAADPFAVYRALRHLNPSPYLFFLDFGEGSLAGSSPETLVRVRRGRIEYRPIAGTRPRGATPEADRALAAELRADPKETAEHIMLVDLGRNDVGRVARPGSVEVVRLMAVERYSHVMHLVSEIAAELRPDLTAVDALAAAFPAGTLTGAPKVSAMRIISELEPVRREVYGGAVGYAAFGGDLDFCIAIRTVAMRGGCARIGAGAGVVAASEPDREYDETMHKARALERALDLAEGAGR